MDNGDDDKSLKHGACGKNINNDGSLEVLPRSIDDVDCTQIVNPEEEKSNTTPTPADTQCATGSGLKQSNAWKYFQKESNATARCNICNKVYKHGGNTTNLFQHLNSSHALLCSQAIRQKRNAKVSTGSSDESADDPLQSKRRKFTPQGNLTRIDEAFSRTKSFLEGGKTSDKITNAILYMICIDKMPLSTVDNEGFKLLLKATAPLYTVPSRKTITRLIDIKYEELRERFIATLKEADSYSITCDNWTDVSNQSYIGITIHYVTEKNTMKSGCVGVFPMTESHTSQYLGECLISVIEAFNLEQTKITAIVTDSAANIKKAIRDFFGVDKHLACFAHTVSHLVPDVMVAMPTVRDMIAKVKSIVTITRRSVVACDELRKLQMRNGKTGGTSLKFIQDVPTRWNSTLHMLQRFITLEEYVYPVISKCPTAPDMLKRDEIQVLKEIVALMKPVEEVITEVSGDSYPTASVIIPLVHCLKGAVGECKPVTKSGIEFKGRLEATIDRRFENFELHKILAMANILDPRFKKLHFQNALAASSAISRINDFIKKDTVQKTNIKVSEDEPTGTKSLWKFHDRLIATKPECSAHNEAVSFEMRQYLSQPVISRNEDPLKYWSSMKLAFPSLHKLAIKYVSIVGTSVPSERLFSQAGDIKTDNRSRLSGEHLNKLLFLSSLARKDWGFE